MPTVDEAVEAQIRNIEAKYGKSLEEWIALIKSSSKTKHSEILAMLKTEYGVSHGDANRLALRANSADAASLVAAAKAAGVDPVDDLFAGKKAELRPIYEALIAWVSALGDDIERAPKKGYVSLRRKKQFAMIQPTTATRVDLGLNLKGAPVTERLEEGSGFNAMFTHRVRLTTLADVDEELLRWVRQAYELAG